MNNKHWPAVRTNEKYLRVRELMTKDPTLSTRKACEQVGMNQSFFYQTRNRMEMLEKMNIPTPKKEASSEKES